MTRHVWQVFKVKSSKVKVTGLRVLSADKNAITRLCIVISTSNVVGIIDVWINACGTFLRRSVKHTGSGNVVDIQHTKCKKNNEKRRPVAEILHSIEKRGRWIERRCTNLQRKFIYNRLYSCAVQMLLKMAVNATKCSTFEDQSHARTVVRECCKGDDESQWERGKFDPRHPKTP